MTEYKLPIIIGTALGIIHGIILMAALDDSFKIASLILYKNPYYLSLATVAIVDLVILVTVISSGLWLPRLMDLRDELLEEAEGEDEE